MCHLYELKMGGAIRKKLIIKRLLVGIQIPVGILIPGHVTTAQLQKIKMEKKPRTYPIIRERGYKT